MNYILIKKGLLYIKNSSYIFRFCDILNNIDCLIHLLDVHNQFLNKLICHFSNLTY